MPGNQEYLSRFIEELITASNSQVEELTTVASGTSDQLTALQNMVTALGEVKTLSESNLGYFMKLSDEEKIIIPTYLGRSTVKEFRVNVKGTIKIKGTYSVPGVTTSDTGTWYFRIHKNGTLVKEIQFERQSSPGNTYAVNETIQVDIDDVIKISTPSSYDDCKFENGTICYELINKIYTNPDIALLDI